jgi:hypothetical protein
MLILSNLDLSPLLRWPLRIFSGPEKALKHLRDHVLTPPESYCWSLVVPAFRSVFDPDQSREVNRLARRLFSNPLPDEAQLLYDGYADAIRHAARDAIANGWFWQELEPGGSPTWHAIGKSGLYVIWDENVVRTAFFKMGGGNGSKSRGKEKSGNQGPLPRKRQTREKAIAFGLGLVLEDTPQARFLVFGTSWHVVRLAYGRACLQQRRVPGTGQMDHWRNKQLTFKEWLGL